MTVVHCPAGTLRGAHADGIDRFAGIPYAHPPIGPLRFAPAVPLPGWTGELDATGFGPASAQVFDPQEAGFEAFGEPGPAGFWVGREDSLTVNIWRPQGDAPQPLPVVIWIHGGANWLESSRLPFYDGARLAARGMIVVSLNYRLGIFGFLDLSPIGGPAEAQSHGLTDQLAAIEWVVANIAAFGGDPGNITLMGNSAGSMDASWHLASGRLPAGVRRLVLSSGVAGAAGLGHSEAGSAHDPAEGRTRAAAFLANLGYSSFADLTAAPTEEILTRQRAIFGASEGVPEMDTLFYPRIGTYSAQNPFDAAAAGAGRGREVIIGFTNYEMGLWLEWDDGFDQRGPDWAAGHVPHVPSAIRPALPDLYRQWFPAEPDGRRGMHLIGDVIFALPSLWFADLLSAQGAQVHCYRFDWFSDPRFGALHCADIVFLFGAHDAPAGEAFIGPAAHDADRDARQRLSDEMQRALLDFARTGDPGRTGPDWPPYTTEHRHVMLFDTPSQVARDPMRERRVWWTDNVLPARLGGRKQP